MKTKYTKEDKRFSSIMSGIFMLHAHTSAIHEFNMNMCSHTWYYYTGLSFFFMMMSIFLFIRTLQHD